MKQHDIDFLYHVFLSVLTYGRTFEHEGMKFEVSPAGMILIDGRPGPQMKSLLFDPDQAAFRIAVDWTGKQMEEIAKEISAKPYPGHAGNELASWTAEGIAEEIHAMLNGDDDGKT